MSFKIYTSWVHFFETTKLCVQRYDRQGRLKCVLSLVLSIQQLQRLSCLFFFITFTGDNTSHVSFFHFVFVQTVILYNSVYPRHGMLLYMSNRYISQWNSYLNAKKRETNHIFQWPTRSEILNHRSTCEKFYFQTCECR